MSMMSTMSAMSLCFCKCMCVYGKMHHWFSRLQCSTFDRTTVFNVNLLKVKNHFVCLIGPDTSKFAQSCSEEKDGRALLLRSTWKKSPDDDNFAKSLGEGN